MLIDVIILAVATAIPSARLKAMLIPHEEDMFGVEKVRLYMSVEDIGIGDVWEIFIFHRTVVSA